MAGRHVFLLNVQSGPPFLQDKHTSHNHRITHSTGAEMANLITEARATARPIRQLDVYCGPCLVATATDRPGFIFRPGVTDVTEATRHSFCELRLRDGTTAGRVIEVLRGAESFYSFLTRLLANGYDLAAAAKDVDTRRPAGRCWSIFFDGAKIGAMWDVPGQFSGLAFQPHPVDGAHSEITCTIYTHDPHGSDHFSRVWRLFAKARGVGDLRLSMDSAGYVLEPKLFNPS
jgi:hypothetical protein